MSLILEALKKLEREKQAPERGFLVVGTAPRPERRGLAGRALAASALVVGLAGAAVVLRPRPEPARPPGGASSPAALPAPVAPALPVAPPLLAPATPNPGSSTTPAAPDLARPRTAPPAATRPAFVLQAISQRDGRPVAVVNERLVREGDAFEGVRVLRIGEAEVELEVDGRRVVVTF